MSEKFDLKQIAKKWQERRESEKIYKTTEGGNKPKFFALDMFPYPSGAGLHVGHPKGYIATDVIARKKILQGYNVLHPMGWDAFGLPAENYAIKMKTHPKISTDQNVQRYKEQLKMFGFTYDRDREINTTDPDFYKRTQWIFIQLYNYYFDEKSNKAKPISDLQIPAGLNDQEKQEYIDSQRLAYVDFKPINRCPTCKTGLSNEDLEEGKCERCGSDVEQKPMRQWVLRITKYAQRLLDGLEILPGWEDSIKEMQRNWIGKSTGTEFDMNIDGIDQKISVFTTRIDTVFGMSFIAMSPEHPLVNTITTPQFQSQVDEYISKAKNKTPLQRQTDKEKTGVFCGAYAINPFNNTKIPIYISDYVLANYGTGVVMAVPAHDERDYEFALKYNLPIVQSIKPVLMQKTGQGAFRPEARLVERPTVGAIVMHPTEDKVIILDRQNFGWKTFIIGGIEEGEDPIQGIKREIMEETGYKDFGETTKMPWDIISLYYAAHKNEGRKAIESMYIVKLNSLEKDEIDASELSKHTPTWVDTAQAVKMITTEGHGFFAQQLANPGAYTDYGVLTNSGEFDGLTSEQAIIQMTDWLQSKGIGKRTINFKIQDWVFARQRYWGEPFPVVFCDKCGTVMVDEKDLPVTLPEVDNYEPTGTTEGPLANITDWVNVQCPKCGGMAKRETNTMPQWAGSSWYWLRYMDPRNDNALVDPEIEKYRGQVDVYVGGAEHAARHLIYARFWHKFLHDIDVVSTDEPFQRLQHVGLVLAEDGRKMSKRRGNVINPDDIINEFGTDSIRVYEMFMGPFAQEVAWSTNGVKGVKKFLDRIVALSEKVDTKCQDTKELVSLLHKTIKKITEDTEEFKYNTSIAQMMIFVNEATLQPQISKDIFEKFVILLSPFAPHLAEELRNQIGNEFSIFTKATWPKYDSELIKDDVINLPVQINGKMRGNIIIPTGMEEKQIFEIINSDEKISKYITQIIKVVYIKDKIINIIVK